VLIECPTAADAATANTQLQPACTAPTIHLSLTQPINRHTSLSAAVNLLSLPQSHLAIIQLGDKDISSAVPQGCQILQLGPENTPMSQLFSLTLLQIARVIKSTHSSLVCIGYSMKESRQKALTKQEMLPLLPVDSVFFLPLDLNSLSQPSQESDTYSGEIIKLAEQVIDVFLHKATDFFEEDKTIEENSSTAAVSFQNGSVPSYRPELHLILEKLQLARCCIVDPLENLEIVIDRVQMAHALDAACKAARKVALPVRTPAWHLIEHKFSPEILRTASTVSKVSLPCVVKPHVACGVEESHQMAFILHSTGLHSELQVPLPALLQEYVDHKSLVWKVYVAGNQVFSVQKRSTPDLQPLRDYLASNLSGNRSSSRCGGNGGGGGNGSEEEDDDLDIPTSIEFHSLESLPTSLPWLSRLAGPNDTFTAAQLPSPPAAMMHSGFLTRLAQVFRKHLGLTLFGFDVVFDYAAGEAVVLDLNFFPSFRGIPEAPVALRKALLERYKMHKK
jgi:hypothetical protein